MKKIAKKLSLSRETIRALGLGGARVVGGIAVPPTQYLGCPTFWDCDGKIASATCGSLNSNCDPNACMLQG